MFDKVCPHCHQPHDYDTLGLGGACDPLDLEHTIQSPDPSAPMTAEEWLDAEDRRAAAKRQADQQSQREQDRAAKEAVQRVIDGFMAKLRAGNPWEKEGVLELSLPRGADGAFAQRVIDTLLQVGGFKASMHHPTCVGPGGRGEPIQVEWVDEKTWVVRVAKPRRA